jgi:hypothetical protein
VLVLSLFGAHKNRFRAFLLRQKKRETKRAAPTCFYGITVILSGLDQGLMGFQGPPDIPWSDHMARLPHLPEDDDVFLNVVFCLSKNGPEQSPWPKT